MDYKMHLHRHLTYSISIQPHCTFIFFEGLTRNFGLKAGTVGDSCAVPLCFLRDANNGRYDKRCTTRMNETTRNSDCLPVFDGEFRPSCRHVQQL